MKIVRDLLLIALALLIQTSWAHSVRILGIGPDIVIIVLVYLGISGGQIEGTLYGFASGFLLDVYSPDTMGINALANSVVGFSVGQFRTGVSAEDFRVQALILFLAVLLHDLIYFLFANVLSNPDAIFGLIVRFGIGTAFYTAVVGVGISLVLSIRFNKGIYLDARRLYG
jgi:rod shape-determining protein MreD